MRILSKAITLLEDIQYVRLSQSLFGQVRFNRLNEVYRPVFQLAKLFYHNHQPSVYAGDERTFTFLVPLKQLFEFSIYRCLEDGISSKEWSVRYQKPQRYLDSLNEVFLLKPDITIWDHSGTKIHMIIDAKYKNPAVDFNVKLSESDVYQMLAYAVRYQCTHLCLVYPKFRSNQDTLNPLASYFIQNGSEIIQITVIHIDIAEEDLSIMRNELIQAVLQNLDAKI